MIKTHSLLKEWNHLKFWNCSVHGDMKKRYDAEENINWFPAYDNWYKALELVAPKDVKIVILGQDPYPTKGYANGLAFSVQPHITTLPGSLRNIFKEYRDDLGYPQPVSGDLTPWASRGVLLLNSCLTVEEGKPRSHKDKGWERLTYEIIRDLGERETPCVFILWGNDAQQYRAAVAGTNHLIHQSSHPSPLSVGKGFFGSRPFSKASDFLGVNKDIWKLP